MESFRDRFIRLAPRFIIAALLFTRPAAKEHLRPLARARFEDLAKHCVDLIEALPECPTPGQIAELMPYLATRLCDGVLDLSEIICDIAPDIEDTDETRFIRAMVPQVMPALMDSMRGAFARLDAAEPQAANASGDDLGLLLSDALEGTPEELSRLMRMFDVDNDDEEPAAPAPLADDDALLAPRDALGVLDGDDQAVRMYLAAQLQHAGIDPEDIFEGEGLDDVELGPLLYCADDDELLERVAELRDELRVAL